MTRIGRYDDLNIVETQLDPIEDMTSLVCGLRSRGYCSDILRTKHGMSDDREINRSSETIAMYVENSAGLLAQAYSGPPEVSFLPLYYAILNLSKACVVFSGKRVALSRSRWHGAQCNPSGKSSHGLLTEEVELKESGALPLFYETLTGCKWNGTGMKVRMDTIYPYIAGIAHEYRHAYGQPTALQELTVGLHGNASKGYQLVARLEGCDHPNAGKPRCLRLLKGFHLDTARERIFLSDKVSAKTEDGARDLLLAGLRRCLLYDHMRRGFQKPLSWTALSGRRLLMPEELPIWIAFYHLSNVVRYNPEFLSRVRDSEAWPMLLGLRKHAVLRFLLLFWSYVHRTSFHLVGI